MSLTELTGNPRHDQLLTLIADRGYMNIDELAQLLDVSTQTVRRDIRKLSEQGLITRHHGGAGRASSVVNTAFEQREVSLTEEKRAIAEAIADYIPDGSTIFITIGTTVEHVARALLNHNHLRIITNSLRVAHILYKNPRFEVMVPGGTLRPHNGGIIGPAAMAFISGFRADYLVTSVGAIEQDGAMMEFDVNEASMVKTMMAVDGIPQQIAADYRVSSVFADVMRKLGIENIDDYRIEVMPDEQVVAQQQAGTLVGAPNNMVGFPGGAAMGGAQ